MLWYQVAQNNELSNRKLNLGDQVWLNGPYMLRFCNRRVVSSEPKACTALKRDYLRRSRIC